MRFRRKRVSLDKPKRPAMPMRRDFRVSAGDRLHAWWMAYRDAKKLVGMADDMDSAARTVMSLVALRFSKIEALDALYRVEIDGYRPFMLDAQKLTKPVESNALGHEGRAWHRYQERQAAATRSADEVVSATERCTSQIASIYSQAECLHTIYVSAFKRHHPRRDEVSNWDPELPPLKPRLGQPDEPLQQLVLKYCTSQVEANLVFRP